MEAPAPLVSVIIATYRAGDYLRQAIESIRAQTFGDYEVLVADDGQDAETQRLVGSFADPRLVYEPNPMTLGPAANHWAAMRRARGHYVAILNHDDLWKPDFLRRMLAGFDADSNVIVAFCDHDVIDPQGRILPAETASLAQSSGRTGLAPGVHRPFPDLAATGAIPMAQAAVFERSALDLSVPPGEAGPAYDLFLNYLLARTGGGAYYVPERLAGWRTHPASLSMATARSDWPFGAGVCLEQMAADPMFAAFQSTLRRRAAACFASAARAALRGGRRVEARRHALRAVRLHPASTRSVGTLGLTLLPIFRPATV